MKKPYTNSSDEEEAGKKKNASNKEGKDFTDDVTNSGKKASLPGSPPPFKRDSSDYRKESSSGRDDSSGNTRRTSSDRNDYPNSRREGFNTENNSGRERKGTSDNSGDSSGYRRSSSDSRRDSSGRGRGSSDSRGNSSGYRGSSSDNRDNSSGYRRSSSDSRDNSSGNRRSSSDSRDNSSGYRRSSSDNKDNSSAYRKGPSDNRSESSGFKRGYSDRRDDKPGFRGNSGNREDGKEYRRDSSGFNKDQSDSRRDSPYGKKSYSDFRKSGYGYNNDRQGFKNHRPRIKRVTETSSIDRFRSGDGPIRLNRYLAISGICSRRQADQYITEGLVSVNGNVITELGVKVNPGDIVKFNGETIRAERKVYILLNKPKDYISTAKDTEGRKTVFDLIKGACPERVFPVGRLDRNSMGIILLTNDGELAAKLSHPKFLKKKIYHVFLDKNLKPDDMDKIRNGFELEDGFIKADEISYSNPPKKDELGVEMHSGKNRIVRRVFEHLGYKVIKLDRVLFAGLTKKNLQRGKWRFLTDKELTMLKMNAFE